MTAKRGNWEGALHYAVISDVGMRRDNNQDAYAAIFASDYTGWLQHNKPLLLMVADGMGAHAAGELASKLAVDGIPHVYQKYSQLSAPEALQKAVQETNAEVHRRGQANADFTNMGTTVSVLLLLPQGALVGHIGDSRIYRLRRGTLHQLTFDHSLVWEMRRNNQLPKDAELANAIPKNVITRSLGPYPQVEADIEGPLPLEPNDVFLLCTDGLTGKVTDSELAGILNHLDPPRAASLLVDLANLRGGPDNITVIVAKVGDQRMSTSAVAPAPIIVGAESLPPPALPAAWIATSVLVLASLLALIIDQRLLAGGLFVAAVVAASVAQLRTRWRSRRGVPLHHGRKLGRAPYQTVNSPAASEFAQQLRSVLVQLREQARTGQWEGARGELDESFRSAEDSLTRGDAATSIRQGAQIAHDLMARLRAHQARSAADTSEF